MNKGNAMNYVPRLKSQIGLLLSGLLLAASASLHAQQAAAPAAPAAAKPKVEFQWLGQAGWRIVSPSGKLVVIDPWIKGGPKAPKEYKDDLKALGPIDLLLVTHAHGDHLGDAPDLAKLNNTKLYGPADMVTPLTLIGAIPPELGHRFNKSGTVGFIVEFENGTKIWHMGDTGMFGDMKFIADHYKPDIVMVPIGGNFTMGPEDAAFVIKTWIKPKMVIPMHYGSNPLTPGTLAEFEAAMKGSNIKIVPFTEGQKQSL